MLSLRLDDCQVFALAFSMNIQRLGYINQLSTKHNRPSLVGPAQIHRSAVKLLRLGMSADTTSKSQNCYPITSNLLPPVTPALLGCSQAAVRLSLLHDNIFILLVKSNILP